MVASGVTPHPHETREFLLALFVALVTMTVVALTTLYLFGYAGGGEDNASDAPVRTTFTNEDLTPAPRPTAVWPFRPEWRKPPAS
jgi:hypothetical protein